MKVEVSRINCAIKQILIFLKNEAQTAELTDLKKSHYCEPLLAVLIECLLGLYRLEIWCEVLRWLNWMLEFSAYDELKAALASARMKQ